MRVVCARNKKGKQIKLGEGEASKKTVERRKKTTNESAIRFSVKGGDSSAVITAAFARVIDRVHCSNRGGTEWMIERKNW